MAVSWPDKSRIFFVASCYLLSNFFTSAFFPLLDNRVFVILSKDPRFSKELFGRQRLFGTLGQSLIQLATGKAFRSIGFDAMFLYLIASAVVFILLIQFGIPNEASPSPLKDDKKGSLLAGSRKLLWTFDFPFFLLILLIASTTRGVAGNFLPQYYSTVMKLSPWELSLMMQTRLFTELATFFFSKQIIQCIGVGWMLFIAQFSGFLRVFAYSVIPPTYPWTRAPLLIELLKGVNNACLTSAGIQYIHDSAPVGTEATAQGFYSGVHSYLANATAGLFSGWVLFAHKEDPNAYYALFSYTALLAATGIIFYSVHRVYKVHRVLS
ncbi:hypothetical protein PSACC_00238 [Paramicrosporidium saccamoebae]|uniref:Major facilitator superfamily associated domain-containing protein n=1 Tax=Paramicrosporidium saccamoebae TaxID=1246581 RepID=A0A2H9TQC0_9FUNG|nr:hypothetical protein PSACC_00238 [Paramicrosporidium saccamoebae]